MTNPRGHSEEAGDTAYRPETGVSRSGAPLSLNRAPASDLEPWIARVQAAKLEAIGEANINCHMFNDTAFVRVLLAGQWSASTADGTGRYFKETPFFGPHSHAMPISCTGDVMTVGISFRPGALHALGFPEESETVDRIVPSADMGFPQPFDASSFDPKDSPEQWIARIEAMMRDLIAERQPEPPSTIAREFERLAFADPTYSVADFAEQHDISTRTLERIVKRDFGMTPKRVLRRARALDLASRLCGVFDEDETEAIMLRYFDQSHQIREFHSFFDCTPRQFVEKTRPLLTLNLESRQARRLEELRRVAPDGTRPWMDGIESDGS
ncbi:AraC family transcriptional regulator [Erythrobacter sp. HKB08]|uniref:helix-turn-helix domain-containing protein n=1 Tax=Erythrobacter sp. HKB08 TaxID=2502843 RepID=UPI001009331F|nr:helix-turn-helix domain-containing protein [Erythrobacter sp. HKB08]